MAVCRELWVHYMPFHEATNQVPTECYPLAALTAMSKRTSSVLGYPLVNYAWKALRVANIRGYLRHIVQITYSAHIRRQSGPAYCER